jgi:hypothetical protein
MKFVNLWLCVACVLLGSSLSATTLVPADFAQMARESELIVRGTVVNVQGQMTGPRRTIESLITVFVTDTLKGTAATQAVFRVPGGRVGAFRRVMVGAPEFAAGDDVILFLKGRAPAIAMPYGLSQGVYRVARQGGSAVVTPAVVAGSGRVVRGDPSRRPLDPATFAREVQRALGTVVLPSLDAARDGPEPVEGPNNRRAIPRVR